ncbi:hypothetical protein ABZV93_27310 [Actinopolymorpha sp. NPDC004070]|uniref:hypothetical protein n=1 Tax=Actinopolymorpha sp. NPDC004070 TaxID=3154548 RepID=UPI0033BCD39C
MTAPGGVGSVVRWADGRSVHDSNGFVTALAVREVRRAGKTVPEAWLDLLETCRRPNGSYGFWPYGATPAWAPELPADSDDTAVMLLELERAGRVSRTEARSVACHTVGAHRLRRVLAPGPPWLRQGMFTTWHRRGAGHDIDLVDLTAATNVLALLYSLGLQQIPGVEETLAGLTTGLEWAASSAARWQSLSPFYPEPDELARALDHATHCGVRGLTDGARTARQVCPRQSLDAVCSMAYGPPTWHSSDLAAIRRTA